MKPSGAGRAFHALGYRAKPCLLCNNDQQQRAAAVAAVGGNLQ